MANKFLFTIGMIVLVTVGSFGQDIQKMVAQKEAKIDFHRQEIEKLKTQADSLKLLRDIDEVLSIAIPYTKEPDSLTVHSAMVLLYNEEHEQADWVAHKISVDIIGGGYGRTNDFREDPKIASGTAVKADYWYSGFDRGHLAPSADFRWSKKAISESYYYSNMSPQRPEFNREGWADLENALRRYVEEKQRPLYVVTGPYYSQTPETIGENKVSVPQYYFKTALDYSADTVAAIGFLMPNSEIEYPTLHYAMTIDSLEAITGLDFYYQLPDSVQDVVEAVYDYEYWKFMAGDKVVLPIHRNALPEGTVNTVQARSYYDKKATVCGTVSSSHISRQGHLFLNFDGQFPNQLFWCTIWKSDLKNFSYDPKEELLDREICVSGVVKQKYGKPSMSLSNEKNIQMFDELIEK